MESQGGRSRSTASRGAFVRVCHGTLLLAELRETASFKLLNTSTATFAPAGSVERQ